MKLITFPITVIIVFIAGCTSIPNDLGRSDVDTLTHERGLPVETETSMSRDELLDSLTEQPLTADSAIRIALINNPRIMATYAELGIAAADVYEAGRIRNPIFSFSTLDSNESGAKNKLTYGLVMSFTDLITLSSRKRLAEAEFAVMKQSVGAEVLNIAAQTETAFYEFVAAKQAAALRNQITKSGEISFELAKRYYDAGNLTQRELALEHATASELQLDSLDAEAEAYAKRTKLATLLGLSAADAWDSPAKLPVPLDQEDDLDLLIDLAQKYRLDLAAARARADIFADRLGVTNWTRWIGELDIGIEHEREPDGADLTGPTFEWEVPVFNQGQDAKLRVNTELVVAIAEVEQLTLEIENDVRLAYAETLNSKEKVNTYKHHIIPARIEAVARAQEEENFMLIGIFELLETKQDEYDTYQGYLEGVRDYWLARTDLSLAVGNSLPSSEHVGGEYLNVEDYIVPKTSSVDHSQHNMDSSSDNATSPQDEHDAHSHH